MTATHLFLGGALAGITTRDEVFGAALAKGGLTLNGSNQSLVAANTSRRILEVSNRSDNDVALDFTAAATAVLTSGTVIPAHSSAFWPTTAACHVIGTAGGVVTYTEW